MKGCVLDGTPVHLLALLCATLAGFGTTLAMGLIVPTTFLTTGSAGFRADPAASAKSEPLAIKVDAVKHSLAESRSSAIHRTIILTLDYPRHWVAQCSHSTVQALQASIQL